MIGAFKALRASRAMGDRRSMMSAHIVEGSNLAILAHGDNVPLVSKLASEVVTWLVERACVAHELHIQSRVHV